MKNITRTMHERDYQVTAYVASEDSVETVEVCRHEASKEPEGVGENILHKDEMCKVLRQHLVSDITVQLSVPINVFVNAAKAHGTIKCVAPEAE